MKLKTLILAIVISVPMFADHKGLMRRTVNNPVTRTTGRGVKAVVKFLGRVIY